MLTSLALWPAEHLLNQIIRNDEHIARQLQPFAGKAIEIQSRRPSLTMVMRIESGSLSLSGVDARTLGITPDARIAGDASELLQLLLGDESRPLANRNLVLSGDTEFFQEFHQRLQTLDLRWEDYLAPLLGDVVTQQASQFQQQAAGFASETGTRLKRNVEDYLKEEAQLVPHEYAVEQFQENLEALRLRIDRASARTQQLKSRLDQVSD